MIDILKSLGLPGSIVAMFLLVIFIMSNHAEERKEWGMATQNLTNQVFSVATDSTEAVTSNTKVMEQLSDVILSKN